MNLSKYKYITFIFFFFAQLAVFAGEISKQTFVYSIKGNDTLRLDKYNVSGGDKPCLIFMFGGSFSSGRRDNPSYLPFYEHLASNGYTVLAIDYRLGMKDINKKLDMTQSKSKIFDQFVAIFENAVTIAVADLFDATAYTVSHAADWGIDRDLVVACGSSAGAVAVLQGEYEICNQGLLSAALPEGFNYAGVISFAGAVFNKSGDLSWKRHPAPIQFFHGDADKNVPYDMVEFRKLGLYGSNYIANQLDKLQSPYYFFTVENVEHEISVSPMKLNWHEIDTFLEKFVVGKQSLIINTTVQQTGKPVLKKKLKLSDYIHANFSL
jgi:hypothetical protein